MRKHPENPLGKHREQLHYLQQQQQRNQIKRASQIFGIKLNGFLDKKSVQGKQNIFEKLFKIEEAANIGQQQSR